MKITIPENLQDITVEQYIKYQRICNLKDIGNDALIVGTLAVFCNLTTEQVLQIDSKEVKNIANQILDVLQSEPNDIIHFGKFSRIPNLDDISQWEYIDLDTYGSDFEQAHKFMAVFYRPKTKQILSDYQIEKYKGTEAYENEMLKAPLEAYLSAMVFFWNLSIALLKAMKEYLQSSKTAEVEHLVALLQKDGVGIHQFIQSLEESILISKKLLKPTYTNF